MTDLDLFPRGKSAAAADATASSSTSKSSSGKRDARKRKSSGAASPEDSSKKGKGGKDKDWLFGGGGGDEQQSRPSVPGKRPRGESSASSPGSIGASKGKKRGSAGSEVGSGMLVEHSGRAPRLEMVSFKKLNKGTLAMGVVFKINEHDMVVSLPSSLTGVVRRQEVSDYFHQKAASAKNTGSNRAGGRGRYFDESQAGEKPLTHLFREGQVVRCAIISLAKEAKGRHIELSLRASLLNKGLSLSQLTKGNGVYGSVASAEDHGYVVTLGLDGVTAFLPKKDGPKEGLEPGQPVEAVIQTVKAAARTVTLTADPSLVSSAVTQGTSFDLRSLKPGMLVDAIVDSVLSNGILVSFLGYFVGCVDHNNMPLVSGDGKDDPKGWRPLFRPGPEPVRARVLLVDYVNKAIRLTLRPHLMEMRAPSGLPPTGALLDGEVVRVDPALGLLLTVPSTEKDDGSEVAGNAPAAKKERGQGRRERRAAAAAASASAAARAAGGDEDDGDDEEKKWKTIGAYVHISRISDQRVEHVEKSYKPGQKVRCRVTGSSLVEGWAATSLRPSVLSAAVLRYEDLQPGSLVEGEVAAVEAFGLLVKLGEGVRALVPKNHLGDVTIKNPKARFKVGARVKGRVLTVDPGSSKSTLTLKRSLVKDKREVISTYTEAKEREGTACTGFVTKVAPFGLHVSFYGNVFGLLPSKALTKHGIQDPSEAFTVGQVVGCVVRSCDVTTYPPKLSLSLDVAGKTEEMGGTVAAEEDDSDGEGAAASCPFSPGDILSGVVSATQDMEGKVVVDLNLPADTTPGETSSEKTKNKKSRAKQAAVAATVQGVLPYPHLGDHAYVCGKTLAAELTPGTVIDQLLVLEVDKMGTPMVTLKPLLLSAVARSGEDKEAFMPGATSDVTPGDLIAGYVIRVESFGVFVRFLGRFTALCPRSMAADRMVQDPRGMFEEGDSARCVVQRVDEDTGRVVVTLDRTTVPTSPGLYLRSLLSETFASAAAGAAATSTDNPGGGEGADATAEIARPWGRLEFGSTTNAVVVALKEYGVVLKAKASSGKRGKDKGGQLMVCPLEHSMDGVEEGNEVKVRVIGMDLEKGVVEVTMDTDLVKAGRSKRLRAMVPLDPGETVPAKVLVAKPNAKWAVAVSDDGQGRLFVLQVADFHCPHRTCEDAGLCPDTPIADPADLSSCEAKRKTFVVRVGESFTPGLEGYWETREDMGASGCNPYAGAVLVVQEDAGNTGKRKSRRSTRGEHLDLGEGANNGECGSDGSQNPAALMKAGRVPLGKIKTGAKVVCEVRSVHWDRLDVKVAVRYPKSYGPSSGKVRNRQASVEEDEKGDPIKGEGNVDADGTSKGSNKRRREETDKTKAQEAKPLPEPEPEAKADRKHRKQMVRIRAKIHCTAAGLPGLDGPAEGQGNDTAGDGVADLPQWHPLEKFHVGQVLTARVLHSEDMVQKDPKSDFVFRLLELGLGEAEGEGEGVVSVPAMPWWGECPPKTGEVHRGVITEVAEHGLLVSLSSSVRGLVPLANISSDRSNATVTAKKLGEMFKTGMGLRVLVGRVEEQRRRLILSLVGVPGRDTLPDSALPAMSPDFQADADADVKAKKAENQTSESPDVGDVVEGRVDLTVRAWSPPCVMVRLDGGGIGRVCVTELSEQEAWKDNPVGRVQDGARVKCRVLPPLPTRSTEARSKSRRWRSGGDDGEDEDGDGDGYMGPVELSLRPSRVEAPKKKRQEAIQREPAPKVGSTAKCYVVATGKSGCFVILDGAVSGRVLLKHLSDRFVSDPAQEFPAGKLVAGKVLAKDKETGRVSLSLMPSDVVEGEGGGLTWSSEILKPGLKVKGTVDTVKDFGVFIQIQDSKVRGMCHRSEAADDTIDDLTQVYEAGDLVKAVVLKVNKRMKRVSLGLKASYFADDVDSDSDDSGMGQDGGEDLDDGNAADSSDANDDIVAAAAMQVSDDGEDEQEDESEDEESEDSDDDEIERATKRAKGRVFGGGLGVEKVGVASAFSLNFGDLGISMGVAGASSDEEEDSDDDDSDQDRGLSGSKSHRSRKKAKERRVEEDRIAARERALQDEDAAPETAGDYERLLVATPNDSLLWVKYMAFNLSLADVEGARAVCERGLKAVSFREEQERFNLWVSLINLEHKYGSRATLKTVSERACQNSNPKKIYLHMAEMHEKAQESEECEEVFKAAVKKFRHSQKVWVAYQLSRLKRGDDAGAREALKRSLQSLARHKHVSVISRFAQNEFEHGSVERGRSVFEGLMASYPKRLDLWNVYLDKEVKAGDLRAARNLLERLTGMDFNAKRMKGVFKKYLQFEMEHGDEAGVNAVKAKATEYVASLVG